MDSKKIICKSNNSQKNTAIMIDGFLQSLVVKTARFVLDLGFVWAIFEIMVYFFAASTQPVTEINLGISYIVVALFLLTQSIVAFVEGKLKTDIDGGLDLVVQATDKGTEINIFEFFSFDLAKASKSVFLKDLSNISLAEVTNACLSAQDLGFVLLRLGVGVEDIKESVDGAKADCRELIADSVDIAIANGHDSIWSGDMLLAITNASSKLNSMWKQYNINWTDISSLVGWQTKVRADLKKKQGLFNPNNLKRTGGIGRDWAYGYTNFMRQYSVNLTESIEGAGLGLEVIGRDKEIRQIEEALTKQTNANVLIVGDAGVGKHTTVLGFAERTIKGDVSSNISHDEIFQINTEAILSGANSDSEIVERFSRVLEEAAGAGNVIVLIENIQTLFAADGTGTANLTAVMMPYLEHSSIHIIGTCEVEPYNKYILSNSAISNHFVRVSVDEPRASDLLQILEDTAPLIEYKTGSIITFEAVKACIAKASKYLVNVTEPERSIGLLDGVATRATTERGRTLVLDKDVDDYMAEKMKLPSSATSREEKENLINLEKTMHKEVIEQDEAIKAVSSAMRRNRANITDSKKPIGSFLFLGPTGVGKTATAKALAKAYFGDSSKMIRFDMSEYQNNADIYRLIGTKDEPGNLTTFITENPFSLLLFDEVEKANPDILNLFLQILDEGTLTDGRDQKVVFSDTIIIATSNAGSDLIRESIESGEDYGKVKNELNDYLVTERLFAPELLNRFTEVVIFSPLSLEAIRQVAKLIVDKLSSTILEKQGIIVDVEPDALEALADLGYDPKMGARPMERAVQDKIENLLADKVLKEELKKDDKIIITKEMIA